MGIVSVLAPIIKIIISVIVGTLAFYLLDSNESAAQKKQHVNEITSQLINFVIFIWISKIILKFSVFVKDPLVVLAYPSNALAFYLAVLFSTVAIAYKAKRQQVDVLLFSNAFMQVFLVASLVYEFIRIVWDKDTYSIGYMTLLALLFIVFLLIRDRIVTHNLIIIILLGWSVGTLALSLIMPVAMVFGYTMRPWFLILFLVTYLILIIFNQRKKVA
ncbi:hypothetical protein [Paenibacillus sp. CMAA1364]